MARFRGKAPIYDVASAFKSLCLTQDKSLLWPDNNVWTLENLNSLKESLIDNPDEGEGTFLEKLEEQLDNQSLDVHRLATEATIETHVKDELAKAVPTTTVIPTPSFSLAPTSTPMPTLTVSTPKQHLQQHRTP